MNIEEILDIATGLLLVFVGVLYTFFTHWFCTKWPQEQQAWQRKLLRIFGPAFLVLGLTQLYFEFVGWRA